MSSTISQRPYGVLLVGEALGEQEANLGQPFVGKAGYTLTRLIEWAGLDRGRFDITNAVWCRPPSNKLEGQPFEYQAIAHCRNAHWGRLLPSYRVIVPMGNVPLYALTGRKGILKARGYVEGGEGYHILPTLHPSFIQRGQSKYASAVISDLQKAVQLAERGLPSTTLSYTLDPLPHQALKWAQEYREILRREPHTKLAYDIETPGKGEDEGEVDDDDPTYTIWRVGFAFSPFHALSFPWKPEYMAAVRLLLEGDGEKVVWNAAYDNPRLAAAGVRIGGVIHDGMVAWHVLHSDLPKGLGFVATFTCPWQPAWKHLSHASPAFYNATDADVELRSMLAIEEALKAAGMWDVYQRDILDLDPILVHMSKEGMPVDEEVRFDRATKLAAKLDTTLSALSALVPHEARNIEHVYVKPPRNVEGLYVRPAQRTVPTCERCGLLNPTKPHFRVLKKKPNPCGGAGICMKEVGVDEYYRLQDFTPSRNQIIRYNDVLGRATPRIRDKKSGTMKVTTNDKALKELMRKFPDDSFYPLVVEYRELQKLQGTYIGKPAT